MTAKAIPRHARTSERQRWVPHPRAGRLHRAWAPGIAQPRPPEGPMSADPLAGPVASTQRAVLGDQIRRPTAWCEMAACISRYDDSAALGEADIRARALGAGWRHDTAGRLICPYCQRRRPALQAASPVAGHDNPPGRRPVARGLAGSAPCGQRCRHGTGGCWVASICRRAGCACSPRWCAAATAGTPRPPALPQARWAACAAPGRTVPAILPGTGQPPLHPPRTARMTTAASRASGLGRAGKPPCAGPGGTPPTANSGYRVGAIHWTGHRGGGRPPANYT